MSTVDIIHANHKGADVTVDAESNEVRIEVLDRVVMVIYDAGWPGSRPLNIANAIAVGGTEAPSWLTGVDVWLRDDS